MKHHVCRPTQFLAAGLHPAALLWALCHSAMADATAPAWSQQPQHWVRVHAYPSR